MCDKTETNPNEFRFITGKKKTRRKIFNEIQTLCNDPVDEEKFLGRLKNVRADMKTSKYFINSLSLLEEVLSLKHTKKIENFICLGIGSFTTCLAALHQFAFSLELCDYFQLSHPQYYDPIFSLSEKNILGSLNCTVMSTNCEGMYTICGENSTILYFPHCPKQLTNNFLWHNWNLERLEKTILICNSFEKLIDNTPGRILQEEVEYVVKIVEYSKEFVLENCYQYQDIFNDTSVHIFGNFRQNEIKDFWKKGKPPKYSDIELITEKIEKSFNL